jgi:hypothetical protein
VLLNWVLEGSNNGSEWFVIDKRIHYSESNQRYNEMMENERELLMVRGATSTWGVDQAALSKFFQSNFLSEQGFCMFRITQLFENSHQSDNLCLSGLELYGKAYGSNWKKFW